MENMDPLDDDLGPLDDGSDSGSDVDEEDDLPDDQSDAASDVEEIDQDEIPNYFSERNGRLFHANGRSPYPLPVDGDEHNRARGQHQVLRRRLGSHYFGPVQEVLAPTTERRRQVLDLGTGVGAWVLDMKREFPHARFDGLDIVPIATRHPPDSVYFILQDISEPLPYADNSVDLVHARAISMAVHDYRGLLGEIARVLRPGGLYLGGEWGRYPAMLKGMDVNQNLPASCMFFNAVNETLARTRGLLPITSNVTEWLHQSGRFQDIEEGRFKIPIGDWPRNPAYQAMGIQFRNNLRIYAESMQVVLMESGMWRETDVERFVQGYLHEMDTKHGMASKYYTFQARKI